MENSLLPKPCFRFVANLEVELSDTITMGQGRAGQRRIIPIIGGRVQGPFFSGKVMHLGADWQTVFADGLVELDTRYAFQTDDGAIIEIKNYGFRHGSPDVLADLANGLDVDPSRYYMRTHARLETADPKYDWVNKTLFVGVGARLSNLVRIELYAIE